MQVEWELTMKCNYSCFYCSNLDKSIHHIVDRSILRNFIQSLDSLYPGVEIFLFGGEPFVHPEIAFIIETFNQHEIPFVIQTNLSRHSLSVIKNIKSNFTLQVSIHPTEIELDQLEELFEEDLNIRTIDVMFGSETALKYYFKVRELSKIQNVFLTPITDFGDGRSDFLLKKYLELKKDTRLRNIVRFEEVKRFNQDRVDIWADIKFSPKGKPCLYKDRYFLYGPNLELYNCCYRIKTDGICPKNKCFLM